MKTLRIWTSLGLAALATACSPAADTARQGNTSERMASAERRPSAPARLSQQELAIRIGPRCPETTKIDYHEGPAGGADYVVTCGTDRFRVTVAPDGATKIDPIAR